MKFDPSSVTAADAFPTKILRYYASSEARVLKPIHPQVYISNECQLRCSFCSCRDRDAGFIDTGYLKEALQRLRKEGACAITLSGGGEPLLHPDFEDIVANARSLFLEVGLVTNGVSLHECSEGVLESLSWMRVSMDEARKEIPRFLFDLCRPIVPAASYVWSGDSVERPILGKLIQLANEGRLHHLRIVCDILDHSTVVELERYFQVYSIPDNVVVQKRNRPTRGSKKCWLPFIKPVIDASGRVYTCCGAQYAIKGKTASLPEELCIGRDLKEYLRWVDRDIPFDGSVCDICYYGGYNHALDPLHSGSKDKYYFEYANFL